jgi:hypothetical protein
MFSSAQNNVDENGLEDAANVSKHLVGLVGSPKLYAGFIIR